MIRRLGELNPRNAPETDTTARRRSYEDLPDPLRELAGLLRHTTITYFDVAARGANPDQPHWSYVPDPALPFYRIGSFTAVEASMSPPDTRTFYVEISHQGPQLPLQDVETKLVQQLVEMKLIDRAEDVLFVKRRTIPVAYVLPGAEVEPARLALLAHLREQRVISTGRYGAWVYAAMEDAIWDGMEAARQVQDWRRS